MAVPSASTGRRRASCRGTRFGGLSGWCSRTAGSSPARSGTTSPTARKVPRWMRASPPRRPREGPGPPTGGVSRLPASDPPSNRRVHLASRLALFDHLPLVVALAPARDTELDLGPAVFDVDPQRDERVALLRHCPDELADLVLVQQELSGTQGIVIVVRRVGPWRDMHVAQPHLAVLDPRVPIAQAGVTGPQRFDLGTA